MDEVTVILDGGSMTPACVARVARGAPVRLAPEAAERMNRRAEALERRGASDVLLKKWQWLVGGEPPDEHSDVIRRFVRGHCAGVGEPLPPEVVRATMLARANVLATGWTGARARCAEVLIEMLNAGVVPVVPSQGSVGAAGDLAPLAHIASVACGYGGAVLHDGKIVSCADAMAGIDPLEPTQKEALALINGATLTVALAAMVCTRTRRLLDTATAACALSFEVVRADLGCLSAEGLAARGHQGGDRVAADLRGVLAGSELVGHDRRPDPFSIRCAPAVLGAARDALDYVEGIVVRELNGACDNPLVMEDGSFVEAGNFHGAPIALAMDHLKVALTQVASIAERRVFRMTYGQLSGLPSFLLPGNGLNSGLMLAQYTAASLVSEAKGLSFPASVDSLPTVQHHEDHVSMGPIAARGASAIVECVADVLAIELLCGAQGLDFHLAGESVDDAGRIVKIEPMRCGDGTMAIYERVRGVVRRWHEDQVMHPDLEALGAAVREGVFTASPGSW